MACKCHSSKGGGGKGVAAVAAVGIALVMAGGHGHKGSAAAVVADSVASPPASGPLAHGAFPGRAPWAADFLRAARLPVTACNVGAVTAWEGAEGSSARFNPLDTERQEPGNTLYNSDGVRNYVSLGQGLAATVATLYNGAYPRVIAALRAGNSAQAVANAVAYPKVWGTEPFTASC